MEARMGRDAAGGSMRYAHDSATGHVFGRGRPDFKARCTSSFTKHREAEPVVPVIAAVWPIRRSLRGAKHRAAGMARRAFPWRQAQRPSGARRHHAKSSGRRLDSATGIHGEVEFR